MAFLKLDNELSSREIQILSYFSLPTDLAAEMLDWPESISGSEYDADLQSAEESVSVRFKKGNEDEQPYVVVRGQGLSLLFDKVLGRVVYALAAHSDNLMIDNLMIDRFE